MKLSSVSLRSLTYVLLCGVALAVPGALDDSQRDFSVGGKEPGAVTPSDFVSKAFRGFDKTVAQFRTQSGAPGVGASPGGFAVPQNQNNFPILNFAGVTGGMLAYEKKGVNSHHVHPRANELVTVIKGGPLACEVIDSTGKSFQFSLELGDTGFFPQGLMHSQQNTRLRETVTMQLFSSANPGVQRTVPQLFGGNPTYVKSAFNSQFTDAQIASIKSKLVPGFPKNP